MTLLSPALAVRPAGPSDLAALVALIERCSGETLYRRFHGAADRPIRREVERMAAPTSTHRSWAAVTPDGDIRGVATLASSRSGTVEAAFLVEDAWRRRGIGRSLFDALAMHAARAGVDTVLASVQADNDRATRFLRAMAPGARPRYFGGAELELAIPVPPIGAGQRRAASAGEAA